MLAPEKIIFFQNNFACQIYNERVDFSFINPSKSSPTSLSSTASANYKKVSLVE